VSSLFQAPGRPLAKRAHFPSQFPPSESGKWFHALLCVTAAYQPQIQEGD